MNNEQQPTQGYMVNLICHDVCTRSSDESLSLASRSSLAPLSRRSRATLFITWLDRYHQHLPSG